MLYGSNTEITRKITKIIYTLLEYAKKSYVFYLRKQHVGLESSWIYYMFGFVYEQRSRVLLKDCSGIIRSRSRMKRLFQKTNGNTKRY